MTVSEYKYTNSYEWIIIWIYLTPYIISDKYNEKEEEIKGEQQSSCFQSFNLIYGIERP